MSVPDKSIDPRLLASAEAEFQKQGFLKAELKTICENAGITTGAVYKRYKGKEDLFCALVDDIAERLDAFVEERSDIDFSSLSDEEIYQSWQMTYDAMIPLFNLLYKHHDTFTLLINKAAGTRYENFNHDFVTRMSHAYEQYYKALNFAGKFPQLNYKVDEIEKAMDNAPLKANDNAFSGDSHIVRFEDVRFAYKEQEVLHGVSLELGEGTLTALVGESGSGKSTLAKLLVHYYDLNGGTITLGGQDIMLQVRVSENM